MNADTLALPNFNDLNILEELEVENDANSGQKVITVINPNGISSTDFIVLNPGLANGELGQVANNGITGKNITFVDNLALLHRSHERAIKIFGSKIKVHTAPNTNGLPPNVTAFEYLATVDIDPDQKDTDFINNNGGPGIWYAFSYFNPATQEETELAASDFIRGGAVNDYCSEEEVLEEAGMADAKSVEMWQVNSRKREAQDEVRSAISGAGYIIPLKTQGGVEFVPDLVIGITKRLAAGLLLGKNFGVVKPGSSKNGADKCESARETLAKIQLNDLILLDSNGQMLQKQPLVGGYPDSTTADDGVNIGPIMTMDKKF